MLIRFVVNNLYSFGKETEFNMLPWRIGRLSHHKYLHQGTEILKQTVIYGANGAGKSNLIKSIGLLKKLVISGELPIELTTQKFKLSDSAKDSPVLLAIEFVNTNKAFSYAIKVNNSIVEEEELYLSGLGKEDKLIFERRTSEGKSKIRFFEGFENTNENKVLKSVIEKDLVRPDKPLLTLLKGLTNDSFDDIKACYSWFSNNIEVIFPKTVPKALVQQIDIVKNFKEFTNELVCSFNTGVVNVDSEKRSIEEYLGEDDKNKAAEIIAELKANPKKMLGLRHNGEEVVIVNENGNIVAKRLLLEHMGESNKKIGFHINEESDGTVRLLEYIPALRDVIYKDKVYIIDEIERSIHPLIVKELISKFSLDEGTKGQLIFSTHESNLLDQDLFRQDEIWFAEKKSNGQTELYPLSEFKEHHTLDIRKGYLNGRYGAIPFLSNLHDLNWHKHAITE